MKKYKSNALLSGKFNFRTTSLLVALLLAGLNVNIFAQNTASPVEAVIQETKQAELIEKEEIPEEFLSTDPAAPELITSTTYAFSAQNGVALEDMSTGTTQLLGASQDDVASALAAVGFDFWFDGVRYTQFSANSNGLLKLGLPVVTGTAANDFATTTNAPKISAYWDDLCTSATGKVHYKVVGAPGNRKLVIEWLNMIQYSNGCVAGGTTGTFQVWLNDSANTASPGIVQFVYGAIGINTNGFGGYSTGLQSGATTNFASVTTSTNAVDYAASNNIQTNAIAAGTSYLFTPNVPLAPTGLTFTATNAVSTTLNFADNAANEVGYAIYRSTDGGATFTFITQTAANVTTYTDSGLTPSTNYTYRVYAVTEGALSSPVLQGSQATTAAANDTCAGAGGNYSAPATWADGSVPTGGDNVIVQAGCTVTVDITTATALNLTVQNGGVLQYITTPASTLTVTTNVTIDAGGSLTAGAGALTTHVLNIGGNLTNNGILDLFTTAGVGLTFTGAANNTFSGTGATNDIRTITINKGTSNVNILELTATNFTVQGVATDVAGFLTLTNGTFKLSGTFTATNRVFTVAGYTIGATTGFWLNNPNFTVAGQNGSPTVTGLFRMTQGTFNIGTGTGNSLGFNAGANVNVEGGAINATGRFGVAAAATAFTYTQSAGTITVQTVGNASTTLAGFDLGTSTAATISLTGGTIVVQLANTATTGPRDYRNQAGTGITAVTGGTLQLGNAASGAARAFTIRGVVPNLVIDGTFANSAAWDITLVNFNNISRNITINAGTTLNLGSVIFLFYGTTLTNNGTLVHNGAASNTVIFTDYAPVLYTGSGTVTAPLTNFAIQATQSLTIDAASPNIAALAVRLFSGNVINSNKITVGNGGTTSAIVQIGNTTTPTAAGTFDVPLTFNAGSGGISIIYLRTAASRTTGGEIPVTRTITNLTYDDNAVGVTLTIAGGNLTVTGALALTNGIILTGANTLIHNGTATRTTGFVAGNLSRSYAATGVYTYNVGDNTGTAEFSPMTATVTALGTTPSSLTVSVVDSILPPLDAAQSASRYWTLTETGDLTADLAFTYLDADVVGDETTYKVFRREAGFTTIYPGGNTNNAATNTATATGVSNFSDWGIGNLAPTAAAVSVRGRVRDANNRAIANAFVTMTDPNGASRTARTNSFGIYRFDEVDAGQTYIFNVSAKRYRFDTQIVNALEDLTDLNFTAQ